MIITVVVVFMFFLFQFAIFNIGWESTMLKNHETEKNSLPVSSVNIEKTNSTNQEIAAMLGEPQYFVISTSRDAYTKNITKTLELMKRSYAVYQSLDELPAKLPREFIGLIICEENLDNIGNIDILFDLAEKGSDIVFAKRFDTASSNYQQYYDRFGVMTTGKTYEHTGIDFLNKILISGIFFDANVTTVVNEVALNGKCLIFAVCGDKDMDNYQERNPVIWRTYFGSGAMYFFNNELLSDFYSVGILTGILSMDKDVYIYPIVNANMVMLDGLPYFSTENDKSLMKTYNRDTAQFQIDTIWTDLLSITKQFDLKYTLYPKIGFGQQTVESELLETMGKMISINEFEMGIYPGTIFSKTFPNYKRSSSLRYVTNETVNRIDNDASNFSYTKDGIVNVPIVSRTMTAERVSRAPGEEPDNNLKFRAFSIASAFGYIAHSCDFLTIFEDSGDRDLWSGYKLNFIEEYYPLIKTYEYLEVNTVTEGGEKIRNYLDIVPKVTVLENEIALSVSKDCESYYILRTTRDITGTKGCTAEKLNNDFYIVKMAGKDCLIYTKKGL